MNKKRKVDLVNGPILPSLLSFAYPILLSNIFQQLYNTADVLIVGRFLSQESLAAVGATTAIFDLIIGFTLGVGNGMGIVIARYYGARNFTKIKEAVAATWILGALLSIVVMLMGFVGLHPTLAILRYSGGNPSPVLSIYFHDCDLRRRQLRLQSLCRALEVYR